MKQLALNMIRIMIMMIIVCYAFGQFEGIRYQGSPESYKTVIIKYDRELY